MMKKMRALLLAAIMMPFLSTAQLVSATPGVAGIKFSAGIKLGANFARLNGDNWDGGYKTNLLGGMYASLHGGKFGVQVEGLFSQSAYTTGNDFYALYHDYINQGYDSLKQGHFRVSYFNIPVLLQYRIMHRVWLQAGPQYSGIISTKDIDGMLKDADGLFKTGALSGVAGLWITFGHFNVGGRYVLTFTNQNNLTDDNGQQIGDAWKRRDVQVHIGYSF